MKHTWRPDIRDNLARHFALDAVKAIVDCIHQNRGNGCMNRPGNVFLRDRLPCSPSGSHYDMQFCVERNSGGGVHATVSKRNGRLILDHQQNRHDIGDLVAQPKFKNLNSKQRNMLRALYQDAAPKEMADLLSNRNSGPTVCGHYTIHADRDELFAAVVEVVYLMRCHLFHGELSPTRKATECYEPAYRIVRRFLEHVQWTGKFCTRSGMKDRIWQVSAHLYCSL